MACEIFVYAWRNDICVLQPALMGFTCLCLDIESPDVCRLDDCIELYQSHPDKSINRTHARARTDKINGVLKQWTRPTMKALRIDNFSMIHRMLIGIIDLFFCVSLVLHPRCPFTRQLCRSTIYTHSTNVNASVSHEREAQESCQNTITSLFQMGPNSNNKKGGAHARAEWG